jgi:biopolymer transport protein ExbD
MSGGGSAQERGEPNLTPILDMVFQLITFFMLVINFKAAALDLTLKLPVVGTARPVETHGTVDLLILNIDSKGDLKAGGQSRPNIEGFIRTEAMASIFKLKKEKDLSLNIGDELPFTTVVVRADRSTPFKLLNRVIKICQDNGYRHFALKAMSKEKEEG